jgi:hypothetical protein
MYFSGVLYAIKNGIEHIKKYNLWHRAQILIFNGIEHMCYIFLWHTGNFLLSLSFATERNTRNKHTSGLADVTGDPASTLHD